GVGRPHVADAALSPRDGGTDRAGRREAGQGRGGFSAFGEPVRLARERGDAVDGRRAHGRRHAVRRRRAAGRFPLGHYRGEYPVTRHLPSVSRTVVTTSCSSRLSNLERKIDVTYSPFGWPCSVVL